jgi:hypothetical protein
MFPTKQNNFRVLAIALLLAFVASGCGKDKSLDDYQQQQSNEEFAKMQAVAVATPSNGTITTVNGTYPFNLSMSAVLNPVQNGDNTGTSARASLQGNVTIYTNGVPSSGVITTANFLKAQNQDSETVGTINGTITVVLSSSGSTAQSATFSINGTLTDGQFRGVITPTDRPGIAGTFTVRRDAALPGGQGSHEPSPGQTRSFSGYAADPNCSAGKANCTPDKGGHYTVFVGMTVNPAPSSSGYAFVNLFADVKLVNVHLQLNTTNIPLPPIEFDQRAGTLSFNGSVAGSSGSSSQIIFACNTAGAGYNCSYENVSQAATYEFRLSPGSSVVPTPAPAPTPDPGQSPVPHHPHK